MITQTELEGGDCAQGAGGFGAEEKEVGEDEFRMFNSEDGGEMVMGLSVVSLGDDVSTEEKQSSIVVAAEEIIVGQPSDETQPLLPEQTKATSISSPLPFPPSPPCPPLSRLTELPPLYLRLSFFLPLSDLLQLQYLSSRFYRQTRKILLQNTIHSPDSPLFWETLTDFPSLSLRVSPLYNTLSSTDEPSEHSLDLDRTFLLPSQSLIQSTRTQLDRILRVLTLQNLYFQGLPYIVSAFLHSHSQLPSYIFTRYLLSKTSNYHNNLPLLTLLSRKLQCLLRQYHPRLCDHFVHEGLPPIEYFSTRWFIGMFSYDVGIGLMLGLWRLVVLSDENMLVCFGVVGLGRLEGKLVGMEGEEINRGLKGEGWLKGVGEGWREEEVLGETVELWAREFGGMVWGVEEEEMKEGKRGGGG